MCLFLCDLSEEEEDEDEELFELLDLDLLFDLDLLLDLPSLLTSTWTCTVFSTET
jgi:hypothetical protein